jgi:hypothetical protein
MGLAYAADAQGPQSVVPGVWASYLQEKSITGAIFSRGWFFVAAPLLLCYFRQLSVDKSRLKAGPGWARLEWSLARKSIRKKPAKPVIPGSSPATGRATQLASRRATRREPSSASAGFRPTSLALAVAAACMGASNAFVTDRAIQHARPDDCTHAGSDPGTYSRSDVTAHGSCARFGFAGRHHRRPARRRPRGGAGGCGRDGHQPADALHRACAARGEEAAGAGQRQRDRQHLLALKQGAGAGAAPACPRT